MLISFLIKYWGYRPVIIHIKDIRSFPAQYHRILRDPINIRSPRDRGRNIFQVRNISRSYRIRGRVPRIHRNEKAKNIVILIIKKS